MTTDQLDALLGLICAPDVRSILTNRPPRIAVRNALLELRAGRRLDAGERIVAIHGIGRREGWPSGARSISLASASQVTTVETPAGVQAQPTKEHEDAM